MNVPPGRVSDCSQYLEARTSTVCLASCISLCESEPTPALGSVGDTMSTRELIKSRAACFTVA